MGLEDDDKPEDKGDKLDYDVNATVAHLKNNAHEKSQGQCAKAVREALEAGALIVRFHITRVE